MFVIRPIKDKDLAGLMELLKVSGHGLTSLPKDEEIIRHKILISERSVAHRGDRPGGEAYLFVMEELFTGKIVGVSGIISKIGGFEAYYFYHLKSEVMKSQSLSVEKEVKSLHFEKTHSGPAEICSLFLSPEFRNSQNGRFLSLSRFLYMAENRRHFEDNVIAEMRGRVNDEGHSPFWDAVGQKFMNIDFVQADYLQMKSRKFIDELLPKYPILVDLLPKEAQDVVAQVHPNTEPAKRILEQEGFQFNGLVGIFEPGPVLEAPLDEVRALKESKVLEVGEIVDADFESDVFIISNSGKIDFKACLGKLKVLDNGKAQISAVTATALKLRFGERLRYVSLKAKS
ncbi:MAG: arginine N-succinyltransferase [Halobacteriovoraceae bacterium]|nr:arginine N-succinyltransferase [Halobacteriovoraceae bacterium]|tara:strand:+ start:426 stop:1454 length:1029 start_codon:yes stop_codon:yes gene_type:complete